MRLAFEAPDIAQTPVMTLMSDAIDPHLGPLPQREEVFLRPELVEGPLTLPFLANARES